MGVEEFHHEGIWVTHARPVVRGPRPPLLFAHGGSHASWSWEHLLPFFVDAGWECLAFDWFNHGRSASTDPSTFLRRGIAEITTEIGLVAGLTDRPPVLVGHSMGAAACQLYATRHEVSGLVLLAPVVPAGPDAEPIEMPVDPVRLFEPVPFDLARQMFFTSLDEPTARHYHALLCPESPRAVLEATRWEVALDLDALDAEALVFAGGRDMLSPPKEVESFAHALGAAFLLLPGCGHDDLLLYDIGWRQVATTTLAWLRDHFDRP